MCVYCVYLLCKYKHTLIQYIYFENIYMDLHVYIYIYIIYIIYKYI